MTAGDDLHLRDARLLRALQEAPDAQSLPDAATRSAILAAAARAVAPPAAIFKSTPWWRRLWASAGERSLPWNAAFATVALATLVTVLWREQEIPQAAPEAGSDRQAPAAVARPPAAPPATSSAPAAAAPSLADRTPRPAPPEPAREVRARSQAPVAVPAPRPAPLPPPPPPPAAQAAPPEAATRDAATGSRAGPPADNNRGFAEPAPAPAPAARPPMPSIAQASPRADAALSKAAPAAAPARLQRRETVSALPMWDRLQMTLADGRVIDLARGQAGRLPDLLAALLAQATGSEPLEQAVQLRIALLQGDVRVGVLEIAPPQAAWRPAAGGGGTLRPDAQLLRELMEEALRLGGPR